jgi:exopolysaccharide production protein ExoQ
VTGPASDRLRLLERAVVCVALLLSLGPVLPSTRAYAVGQGPDQQPVFQVFWAMIYAAGLLIALRHRAALWRSTIANIAVVAPVGLVILSVFWSDAASVTVRQGVALILTTVFALVVAELVSLRALFVMLSWVIAVLLVVSFFVAVAAPAYGIDYLGGGAWQGVFATKNELGRAAALAVAVWSLRLLALPRKRLALVVVGFAVVMLLKSDSRTSFLIAGASVCLVALVPMLRADPFRALAGSMFGVAFFGLAGFWLFSHQELILSTLNATPTLTGRSQIWAASWHMARQHFWLGYGYGAFWLGANGPSLAVWNIVGSTPPHAHNGVLDVWLDLGAIGVALVGLSFLVLLRRAWLLLRAPGTALNAWPMLFCLFLAMSNVTESTLLVRNSVFWLLTVALAAQAVRRNATAAVVAQPAVVRPRLAVNS